VGLRVLAGQPVDHFVLLLQLAHLRQCGFRVAVQVFQGRQEVLDSYIINSFSRFIHKG
jgi:hypothetical protein